MTPIPYAQFMAEVLDIYDFKARKTVAKIRQVLREFAAVDGIETTADLRPAAVARWRRAHPDRKAATVDSLLRSLRSAIAIGIASGYIETSPLDVRQVWPERDDEPAEPLERHHPLVDIRTVLEYLRAQVGFGWPQHRLYALACTVAYTGLRRNEALHLTVPDLDFERHCIRVVARRRLKTRASAQPVGMPDELAAVLRAWTPQTGALWLFPNVSRTAPWTGGPPGQKPLDKLKAAGRAAGVEGFTFLSLRHSWATHGEYWGLGETMIQRQLRHTTTRTQQHYRHADTQNLASSVRAISFQLDEADQPSPLPRQGGAGPAVASPARSA